MRTRSRASAKTRSSEFSDKRLSYYWDGNRLTGQQWQKVLGTARTAWDIYLLYGADREWGKEPAAPDFWMHQLGGVSEDKYLDPDVFAAQANAALRTK